MSPISTITKVEHVRRAFLAQIFSGRLRPGQRLVEAKLALELGVSQATVNAALQDLHNQGIVTKLLNRSTNVCRYTQREIENLFSVRLILEPEAAACAARSLKGVHTLNQYVDQMRSAARSNDLSQFCLADYSFHQEVYALSLNPFLIQACQAIAAAPFAYMLCDCPAVLPTDYSSLAEDHQQIVASLQQGPDAAARFVRERIEIWRRHSTDALAAVSRNHPPLSVTGAAGACPIS